MEIDSSSGSSDDEITTSDSESDSSQENNEIVELDGDKIELPQSLCENYKIFREFFSARTWNSLQDSDREYLKQFLPAFPEKNEYERNTTLLNLFNGSKMGFTSPLDEFFNKLKSGYFRPDITKIRMLMRKAQRREAKCQQRRYVNNIVKDVIASRQWLLDRASTVPSSELDTTRLAPPPMPIKPYDSINDAEQRTKRRYFNELTIIKQEVGENDNWSDDESYPEGPDSSIIGQKNKNKKQSNIQSTSLLTDNNYLSSLNNDEVISTTESFSKIRINPSEIYITDDYYRVMLHKHKRRKLENQNRIELNTDGITIDDIINRTILTPNDKKILSNIQKSMQQHTMNETKLTTTKKSAPIKKEPKLNQTQISEIKSNNSNNYYTNYNNLFSPGVASTSSLIKTNQNKLSNGPIVSETDSDTESYIDPVVTTPPKTDSLKENLSSNQIKLEQTDTNIKLTNNPMQIETTNSVIKNESIPNSQINMVTSLAQVYGGRIQAATLSDLEGIDMLNLPVDLDDTNIGILEEITRKEQTTFFSIPELMQDTHTSFFALIRDIFCSNDDYRSSFDKLSLSVKAWLNNPISPLNDWYNLANDWSELLPNAVSFLKGDFQIIPGQLENFVPYIELKEAIQEYQWIGAGRDSDSNLQQLFDYWLDHKEGYFVSTPNIKIVPQKTNNNKVIAKAPPTTPVEQIEQQIDLAIAPPPPRWPTNWVMRKPTQEEITLFRMQEKERYNNPHKAYTYKMFGYESVVGPVKGIYNLQTLNKTRSSGGNTTMLNDNRPNYVTKLTLVRDATARLPNGEGTRADICELLRFSQFIAEGTGENVLQSIVSGALDRMHTEFDPCVKYDSKRKIWIYLHRNRTEADFERIHQQYQGMARHQKKSSTRKSKAKPKNEKSAPSTPNSNSNDSNNTTPTTCITTTINKLENNPVTVVPIETNKNNLANLNNNIIIQNNKIINSSKNVLLNSNFLTSTSSGIIGDKEISNSKKSFDILKTTQQTFKIPESKPFYTNAQIMIQTSNQGTLFVTQNQGKTILQRATSTQSQLPGNSIIVSQPNKLITTISNQKNFKFTTTTAQTTSTVQTLQSLITPRVNSPILKPILTSNKTNVSTINTSGVSNIVNVSNSGLNKNIVKILNPSTSQNSTQDNKTTITSASLTQPPQLIIKQTGGILTGSMQGSPTLQTIIPIKGDTSTLLSQLQGQQKTSILTQTQANQLLQSLVQASAASPGGTTRVQLSSVRPGTTIVQQVSQNPTIGKSGPTVISSLPQQIIQVATGQKITGTTGTGTATLLQAKAIKPTIITSSSNNSPQHQRNIITKTSSNNQQTITVANSTQAANIKTNIQANAMQQFQKQIQVGVVTAATSNAAKQNEGASIIVDNNQQNRIQVGTKTSVLNNQTPLVAKVLTNTAGQVISIESLLAHQKQHGSLPQGTTLRVSGGKLGQTNLIQLTGAIPNQLAQFAVVSSQGNLVTMAAAPRLIAATTLANQNNQIVVSTTNTKTTPIQVQAKLKTQPRANNKPTQRQNQTKLTTKIIVTQQKTNLVNKPITTIAQLSKQPTLLVAQKSNLTNKQSATIIAHQSSGSPTLFTQQNQQKVIQVQNQLLNAKFLTAQPNITTTTNKLTTTTSTAQPKLVATQPVQNTAKIITANISAAGAKSAQGTTIRMLNSAGGSINFAQLAAGKQILLASKSGTIQGLQGQNLILRQAGQPGQPTQNIIINQARSTSTSSTAQLNVVSSGTSSGKQTQQIVLTGTPIKIQNFNHQNILDQQKDNITLQVNHAGQITNQQPQTVLLTTNQQMSNSENSNISNLQQQQQQRVVLATPVGTSTNTGQQILTTSGAGGTTQQIILPPGFTGGSINIKTLQGIKVIPISQQTKALSSNSNRQVLTRIFNPTSSDGSTGQINASLAATSTLSTISANKTN